MMCLFSSDFLRYLVGDLPHYDAATALLAELDDDNGGDENDDDEDEFDDIMASA